MNAARANPISAAVILAGGQGSRLGGRDKPALLIGNRSLLGIAIDAVGDCPIVVVGPSRDLPARVVSTREDPAGGGPAAAVAAGVAALPRLPLGALIAVLAADLPGIGRSTVRRLAGALRAATASIDPAPTGLAGRAPVDPMTGDAPADGAVLVDAAGRRQILIGVWRADRLAAAIALRAAWHGAPLHDLLAPLIALEIPALDRETEDVDTPDDWQRWQS